MAQSSLFQSLPEAARHSYQISAQLKKPEDGKPATELGNSSTVGEEGKISSANKVLGNSVIDTSSRTLNLIPAPASASRVSSRPGSAASVVSNSASSATNSQQYQQALQIQKQQQLQIQHQLQLHQQQQRVKPPSSHNNTASLYPDRLPGGSIASKFPQTLAGFPPAQSPQWKASVRAPTPASSASPSPSLPSAKNQISLHQQVRAQQQTPHQTQISFSANSAKIGGGGNATSIPSSATIMIGSPQTSVAKGSGGSPRSSSGAKSGAPPTTVLPVLPFQKQQVGKNPSSPTVSQLPTTTNRNMPSILGTPNASKTQPSSSQHILLNQMPKQQHLPQAQLFFSNAYMQPQTSQSDAAVAAAAAGYFQPHQRRTTDLQSAQQQQNSTPGSTGMLSLAPSSLTLTDGGSSAPDASKATGAPPAGGSKGLTGAGLMQQHPSRFPTVSQAGSGPRIL
ncbi:Protein time for coffee [Apostasia shenzhenica]|uniref:Protein time for coffee n=1 Tax=Apostasia shenzhenica TaxID=1088818 RepID=A0A2I0ARS3_9ASPA|nr:Protein time for coffee [Apostasia shenzhenica]